MSEDAIKPFDKGLFQNFIELMWYLMALLSISNRYHLIRRPAKYREYRSQLRSKIILLLPAEYQKCTTEQRWITLSRA